MAFPNTADLKDMEQHPDVSVLHMAGVNVAYWAFNLRKPPFNDVRVRKALSMAINRPAMLEQVYQGTAVQAVSLIPPTMWSHNDRLEDIAYDPKAARQLLAEAGYPNGFKTDLWAMTVARAYTPNPTLMAQMIQTDLAKIGVQAEIKTAPWADYSKRMRNGEHDSIDVGTVSKIETNWSIEFVPMRDKWVETGDQCALAFGLFDECLGGRVSGVGNVLSIGDSGQGDS
jgi:dipeptide transport system substrate-binding protein